MKEADRWIIRGGKPVHGAVELAGSKHSALNVLGALLLAEGHVTIDNFPRISDALHMLEIYKSFGVDSEIKDDQARIHIDPKNLKYSEKDLGRAQFLRSSILLLGSTLLRFGRVKFPKPGGDRLGYRPLDVFLKILDDFGVYHTGNEKDHLDASFKVPLEGDRIIDAKKDLAIRSVNATALAMILAAGNKGRTILRNLLFTAEGVDLTRFIRKLGVMVERTRADTVTITSPGMAGIKKGEIRHRLYPDKCELVFWIVASAMTKSLIDIHMTMVGEWDINNLGPAYKIREKILRPLGILVKKMDERTLRVDSRKIHLRPAAISVGYRGETAGVIADAATHFIPLLAVIPGHSSFIEGRYGEHRAGFYRTLNSMGAAIIGKTLPSDCRDRERFVLDITGVRGLHAGNLAGHDIRTTANLLLAALGADGESTLTGVSHLERGYSDLFHKLKSLGFDLRKAEA